MRKSDFHYSLPPELIAQYPATPRSASRLLMLDGVQGVFRDLRFTDLHRWVIEIPGFDDDPNRSNEKILEAIQQAWIEERE